MFVSHRRRARNPENGVFVILVVFLECKLIWHLFYFLIRDIHRRHRNTIIKHFLKCQWSTWKQQNRCETLKNGLTLPMWCTYSSIIGFQKSCLIKIWRLINFWRPETVIRFPDADGKLYDLQNIFKPFQTLRYVYRARNYGPDAIA